MCAQQLSIRESHRTSLSTPKRISHGGQEGACNEAMVLPHADDAHFHIHRLKTHHASLLFLQSLSPTLVPQNMGIYKIPSIQHVFFGRGVHWTRMGGGGGGKGECPSGASPVGFVTKGSGAVEPDETNYEKRGPAPTASYNVLPTSFPALL